MHHFYHSVEGNTDLAAIRDQANQRTKPKNKYGANPEDSIVHFHRHEEECSPLNQHEFYAVPPLAPHEVAKAFWKDFAYNTGGRNA